MSGKGVYKGAEVKEVLLSIRNNLNEVALLLRDIDRKSERLDELEKRYKKNR